MTLLSARRLATPLRVVPALAASLALLTGCGSIRTLETPVAAARPSGMPDPFHAARVATLRAAPAAPGAGFTCGASMTSPVNGRRLSLVRADKGYGDYAVSGAMGGAVLRLDCLTGAQLGTVRTNASAPRPAAIQAARLQPESATGRG